MNAKKERNGSLYAFMFGPVCSAAIYAIIPFNILLPYDRFLYYLMPPVVVFAAAIICLLAKFAVYSNPSMGRKNLKFYLKAFLTISLVVLLVASRFPALTDKISEAKTYYSYMDLPSYKAGLWLKTHYPNKSTVIVTEKPGLFFGLVSGKFTIMETNPTVERATVAETVLNLAYEMENPVTLYRVFEARMPYELGQYNVLIHNVWKRTSFLYDEETSLSYFENGQKFSVYLSNLERKILRVNENGCKNFKFNIL